ncbi:MAG TPA: plastocyanin/azurin family copper-binding protein [Solirubrobacteraceae bacterium]
MKLRNADKATPWRISTVPLLALAVVAIAIGGCGSSKNSTASTAAPATTTTAPETTSTAATTSTPASSTPASALSLTADPKGELKYNTTSLTAKAGSVAISFTNNAPLQHNVTVESASGATVGATPTFQGGSKVLKLNLKPGTYKFFCSVPGHRMAGMEGTLVVK